MSALHAWAELVANVNGRTVLGQVGVRDPDGVCEEFDGRRYDGSGGCHSDGHYLCIECSHLSPDAPRFHQDRDGRADRLRLFWKRPRYAPRQSDDRPSDPSCYACEVDGATSGQSAAYGREHTCNQDARSSCDAPGEKR